MKKDIAAELAEKLKGMDIDPNIDIENANELFQLFMLEAALTPALQRVIEHCIGEEEPLERFRKTWMTAVAWVHLQHQIIEAAEKKAKQTVV